MLRIPLARRASSSRPPSALPASTTTVAPSRRHTSAPSTRATCSMPTGTGRAPTEEVRATRTNTPAVTATRAARAPRPAPVRARPRAAPSPLSESTASILRCRRWRSASNAPAVTTTTTDARRSSSGRPSRAVTRATPAIHSSNSRVGRCSSHAARPPSRPAGSPPIRPHIITGPAAGPASRFAGNDATGMPPNTGSSTGATPTWAASVMPSAAGTRRRSSTGPTRAMPVHAPTLRRNPIDPLSIGSTSTRAVIASARMRSDAAGRPIVDATSASAAIATARRTDGSHLVRTPNARRIDTEATNRPRRARRRNSGAATAKTNATFCPETARRWLRPDARKSSISSGSCSRSSPRTSPVKSARRSSDIEFVPSTSVRRSWFVNRETAPPADASVMAVAVIRLPMCRRAR